MKVKKKYVMRNRNGLTHQINRMQRGEQRKK